MSIVILVGGPPGGTCPSNPAFPFEVELGSALGDRIVFDASAYPPREVSRRGEPPDG